MKQRPLKSILDDFNTLLHKKTFTDSELLSLIGEWISLFPKAVKPATAYQKLSSIIVDLDGRRKEIVKELYVKVIQISLRDKDSFTCPYFLKKRFDGITMPFETWKEEVLEVCGQSRDMKTRIQMLYFMRCNRCGEQCSNQIIRPERELSLRRRSEYDKEKGNLSQKTTRQQKAAKTKEITNKGEIERFLRPLCGMLVKKGLASDVPDESFFRFTGSADLYAYIAYQVTDTSEIIKTIPWSVITKILIPPRSQGYLERVASEIKNEKRDKPKEHKFIENCLDNILSYY